MTAFSKTPLLDTTAPRTTFAGSKWNKSGRSPQLRQETIDAVSVTGGHFGAGLGVVELTTALHYIFDTPRDRLIWDVGHQAYPHKILTGRRIGLTGAPVADCPVSPNAPKATTIPSAPRTPRTSISAALGMAVARAFRAVRR